MTKTRSEILRSARRAGQTWARATAQSTKDRLRETHTPLFEALEELSELTERGENPRG